MICNVGKTERVIRIVAGIAILALGYMYSSWWGLIGIVPIITGTLRWCPAYLPFNINTNN